MKKSIKEIEKEKRLRSLNSSFLKDATKFFLSSIPLTRSKTSYIKHVRLVKKYAILLAREYGADVFIVKAAALLHDIGADAGKVHASQSAKLANNFLFKKTISTTTKQKILRAIRNHSMPQKGESFKEEVALEDTIIRDADGIAFLEDTYQSFFKARLKSLPLKQAKRITLQKIQGMLAKVQTLKGKKIAKELFVKAKENIVDFGSIKEN